MSSNPQMFTCTAPSSPGPGSGCRSSGAEQQFVKIKDTQESSQVLSKLRGRLVVTGQKMGTQESGHESYTRDLI